MCQLIIYFHSLVRYNVYVYTVHCSFYLLDVNDPMWLASLSVELLLTQDN